MPLRAIIFDFDGLILDTETPEVEAWRKIFLDRGSEFPDSYWINAIGRGADQIQEKPLQLLERLLGSPCDVTAIEAEYEALRMSAIEEAEALPGIRALIQEAKDHGLKLGVASSSHHAWVDRLLQRLDLFGSFDAILCADDVPAAKPFPDLYLAACERLGVLPAEAIALEDSPNGIRAAKAAGLFCVAIPNPCTLHLNLEEADLRVTSSEALNVSYLSSVANPPPAEYDEPVTQYDIKTERIRAKFDEIVAEMKNSGIWEIERPSDEAFDNMGAFGLNTMALEQWLRWVFVPSVESKLAVGGPWPQSSSVGTIAIRNFDGQYELGNLTTKLCEFDDLF